MEAEFLLLQDIQVLITMISASKIVVTLDFILKLIGDKYTNNGWNSRAAAGISPDNLILITKICNGKWNSLISEKKS